MRTGGRAGEQADMTKLIVSFLNFAIAPKNCQLIGKDYVPMIVSVTLHSSISCNFVTYLANLLYRVELKMCCNFSTNFTCVMLEALSSSESTVRAN
jgi:hypothetical protein